MKNVAKGIIEGLTEFNKVLESGEPLENHFRITLVNKKTGERIVKDNRMTPLEKKLYERSNADGVILVTGKNFSAARRLEKKGYGTISSNPGANYDGPRISNSTPNGNYFWSNKWTFCQITKKVIRNDS